MRGIRSTGVGDHRIDGGAFRSYGILEVDHVYVIRAYNTLKEHV